MLIQTDRLAESRGHAASGQHREEHTYGIDLAGQRAQTPIVLTTLLALTEALPTTPKRTVDSKLRNVWAGENGTWVENIAVGSNGNLLVTLINLPEVWKVDPVLDTAELVYCFPDVNVTLGFAEVKHDVFAVNVGKFSVPGKGVPGSWSIWTLGCSTEHRRGHWGRASCERSVATKVAAVAPAKLLNGLTALPTAPGNVLTADSYMGRVFKIDTRTGTYCVAIDDPAMRPNASSPIALGVNGIHVRNGELYFTNSLQSPLLAKVPTTADGSASGPVQMTAESPVYPLHLGIQADDLTIDAAGEFARIVTNPSGVVVKIELALGHQTVVAGAASDRTFAGATSAAFGRSSIDRSMLYVVTDGGAVDPSAAGIRGGTVIALDTAGL
ncbi:hypothetical protein LTR53_000803 [Teratosphaeriaceae sp. CCFEE 6253]|nr:hypothetical protein LTR53_000803 [Teratosphaeriaceae sp. CCFEE 6253]